MNDHDKLADLNKQYNLLSELEQCFRDDLGLTPCVGAELEFYLNGIVDIALLEKKVGYKIKEEKGQGQYEIDLPSSRNLALYAKHIDAVRQNIMLSAEELGGSASFNSKPFLDDYGSAMHIHLNFLEDEDIEKYARILCHYLPETIGAFLPNKEDYLRLDSKFMAPTHISYGGNNRTVLIRIPDLEPKRLEHRLAAADADPAKVIYNILSSVEKGLRNIDAVQNLTKTFGNAFDPQYGLIPIPKSKVQK